MYSLSEQQIEYILNDIRRNGVEMEDLQLNLLDHICCIIEQNLKVDDDFEDFYRTTVKSFCKHELWEIEEETIILLTFKNYYVMKKTMLNSGIFSASTLSLGIIFKFMHWPGSSPLIMLGIVSLSLVFLPLLFTLKIKEKPSKKDKLILGLGAFSATGMSLGILFKVMHWPGANMLAMGSIGIILLLFLPIYFISGIKQAETKTNTAVTSILIIAGCGLFLTLINSRARVTRIAEMSAFVRNEQIRKIEQNQLVKYGKVQSANSPILELGKKTNAICEWMKAGILEHEIGTPTLDDTFESKHIMIEDVGIDDYFHGPVEIAEQRANKLLELIKTVTEYNKLVAGKSAEGLTAIPIQSSILDNTRLDKIGLFTVLSALNNLTQIQMFVLQNEKELISLK